MKKYVFSSLTSNEFQPPNTTSWANAEFEDPTRKDKFLKLIGAKKKKVEAYDPFASVRDIFSSFC